MGRVTEHTYLDPETGYSVFTELGLRARGKCCGLGCRHCPYREEAEGKVFSPAYLTIQRPLVQKKVRVFFWSGGKDSFLALCEMLRNGSVLPEEALLLTTYDGETQIVAHQEIHLSKIASQAHILGLPVVGIPLIAGSKYQEVLFQAVTFFEKDRVQIEAFVFGDLHLQHILDWRNEHLAPIAEKFGIELRYPLLKTPPSELLALWESSLATAQISATSLGEVQIGERFGSELISRLPEGADSFGENGEFHTLLEPFDSAVELSNRLRE